MTVNAAILMAALVLSGTVLAQSSGPSAGPAGAGQAAITAGQAINPSTKTADSGSPLAKAAHPAKSGQGADGSTVGASRPQKPDRRLEHYP